MFSIYIINHSGDHICLGLIGHSLWVRIAGTWVRLTGSLTGTLIMDSCDNDSASGSIINVP